MRKVWFIFKLKVFDVFPQNPYLQEIVSSLPVVHLQGNSKITEQLSINIYNYLFVF